MRMKLWIVLGIMSVIVGSVFAMTVEQQVTVNVISGEINIYSPVQNGVYDSRIVDVNLSADKKVSSIKYSDNGGRFRTLCRNCDKYGFKRIRKKIFRDGFHNVTFIAISGLKKVYQNINFTIDSKKPKIFGIGTTKNREANGERFYIRYSENNLQNISLFYGLGTEEIVKTNCKSGKQERCVFNNIDLSEYDGQEIYYWFEVRDSFNTVKSRKKRVRVDTIIPELIVNMPLWEGVYDKRVPFNISVSEKVKLEYYDYLGDELRWRYLCSRCNEYGFSRLKSKFFKEGSHELLIRAVDKAGNSDIGGVSFCVGDGCEIGEPVENHDVGLIDFSNAVDRIRLKHNDGGDYILDDLAQLNCNEKYKIWIKVENQGNYTENITFNGSVNGLLFNHNPQNDLTSGDDSLKYKTVNFSLSPGFYNITVEAIIGDDVDLSDNIVKRGVEVVC